MREIKNGLSPSVLSAESAAVMEQVERMPQFISAKTVAAYWSLPDEVYTHDFVKKWCGSKEILLPVMREGGYLCFKKYTEGCVMNAAGYNIHEPEGEECSLENIDLIIVPGVAFDREGNRLGRGKGFYDRLLHDLAAYKVGVCFSFQLLDSVPVDPHDVKMDTVISEGLLTSEHI